MTAASSALLEILEGVDAIDVDASARAAFRQLVVAVGAAHGISRVERVSQVAFAAQLLGHRVSRPTVRDRLIAHFDVSRPQAYRIINSALQLSQNYHEIETPFAFNDCTNP